MMGDPIVDEPEVPRLSLAVEHVDHDEFVHNALSLLVHQYDLFGALVPEILTLVPDLCRWRLTLSGDIAATVNSIERREDGSSYTTGRGAGHVGGVTLPRGDGTFDIVIGAESIVSPPGDHDDIDGLVVNALATGRHLARHEAGHVLLALRDEDSHVFRGLTELEPPASGWTDVVAADMDDFRIERHTHAHTPPVFSHFDGLGDALQHLATELAAAKASWSVDLDAAVRRSDIAVSGFIRVIAYLAAELGLDEDGKLIVPTSPPAKWDRYLGAAWPVWSAAFHELRPIDEPMTHDQLVGVLKALCEQAARWASAIGYERGVTSDGQSYAFWTEDSY